MRHATTTRPVLFVVIVLLAGALAGCTTEVDDHGPGEDDHGKQQTTPADATRYAPMHGSDAAVELLLLSPPDPAHVPVGDTELVVQLIDTSSDASITNARFEMVTLMPAMGHGAGDESAPTLREDVYEGHINLFMAGAWIVTLVATLSDGTALEFEVALQVTDEEHDEEMDGHEEMPTAPTFDSFEAALAANGTTYNATGNDTTGAPVLKLLFPHPPQNVSKGEQPAVLLFYNATGASPIEDANVTWSSNMPPHEVDGGMMPAHGGGDEVDPQHVGHGVYEGTIHPILGGEWTLNVTATLADGAAHTFTIAYTVAGDRHDDANHGSDHEASDPDDDAGEHGGGH